MARLLVPLGFVEEQGEETADCILINTCAIREKAAHKVYSYLGRLVDLKRRRPRLVIIVAGCVAQGEADEILKRAPHVNLVLGTHAMGRIAQHMERILKKGGRFADTKMEQFHDFSCYAANPGDEPAGAFSPTAFITIMQGCDNYCTYCVVPHTRGRETSRPLPDVVDEAKRLADAGVKEVTLLGQNVNSYGRKESGPDFVDLLSAVSRVAGIERIRFVTSHPRDLSERLISAFADMEKLCRHIHLPVQSGSDAVLKRMNRGYTAQIYRQKVEALRKAAPGICVSTDFIVGFPGETDEDFAQSLALAEEVKFESLFAFKYSDRDLAPARAFFPKVEGLVKSQRLAQLLELANRLVGLKLKEMEGSLVRVLVEGRSKDGADQLSGRSSGNQIVNFAAPQNAGELIGKVTAVRIEKARAHSLWGKLPQAPAQKEVNNAA
jgi:tRNA-2-methylthio-N6-dimethylallyladenosine synthase